MRINFDYWLAEQDGAAPLAQAQVPPGPGEAVPGPQPQQQQPQAQDQPPNQEQGDDEDVTNDPQVPDRPEQKEGNDFYSWKLQYFDLAIKADANKLIDSIGEVREMELEAPDRKFVEDNMQIQLLRQDANLDRASKEIRKLIKAELDRANPATTLMQHITNTLDAYPQINSIMIKLCGLYALKGDLHRKLIGALLSGVQVGGAGDKEDIIYPDKDYSINISTRFYTDFGEIAMGGWSPQEDDPDKYLAQPEVERLEEGSPEEKQVLRNRVILESIAERFRNRAFLIHVVDPTNGSIYAVGWDIAECLREGYKEGKFVVRPKKGIAKNAMFTTEGDLIPLNELCVFYAKQVESLSISGTVAKEEVPFMERKDGKLYLTADMETIQDVASAVSGFFLKELPYQGNPSDVPSLMRCVPSAVELLMRRCN